MLSLALKEVSGFNSFALYGRSKTATKQDHHRIAHFPNDYKNVWIMTNYFWRLRVSAGQIAPTSTFHDAGAYVNKDGKYLISSSIRYNATISNVNVKGTIKVIIAKIKIFWLLKAHNQVNF